jgi:hypothetical protein
MKGRGFTLIELLVVERLANVPDSTMKSNLELALANNPYESAAAVETIHALYASLHEDNRTPVAKQNIDPLTQIQQLRHEYYNAKTITAEETYRRLRKIGDEFAAANDKFGDLYAELELDCTTALESDARIRRNQRG